MTRIIVGRCSALGVLLALVTAAPVLADYRVERELTLPSGGEFNLRTDSGRLTVRGTSRAGARVVVTSGRDDFEDRFDLTFEETRNGVTVVAERRGSWISRWFSWFGDGVHFEVEVPHDTELGLRTAGGAIEVSEIRARVDARTSGGSIEIQEVSGDARVRTSGGSIRGADIGGDIDADTSGGSINLDGMAGAVKASTRVGASPSTSPLATAWAGRCRRRVVASLSISIQPPRSTSKRRPPGDASRWTCQWASRERSRRAKFVAP